MTRFGKVRAFFPIFIIWRSARAASKCLIRRKYWYPIVLYLCCVVLFFNIELMIIYGRCAWNFNDQFPILFRLRIGNWENWNREGTFFSYVNRVVNTFYNLTWYFMKIIGVNNNCIYTDFRINICIVYRCYHKLNHFQNNVSTSLPRW